MRIVFIGAVQFSERVLKEIIDSQANVVGVCTVSESSVNTDHADLSAIAISSGIPVHLTSNINDRSSVEWVRSLHPDFIFCFGWSYLIKKDLLAIPVVGTIGYHPASLPLNRGRHPLIWALVLGLTETASTFFFMDEGADSGDILSQERVAISSNDNALSLYEKITNVAISQIIDFLPKLSTGQYTRCPQDHSKSNYWRKRSLPDGLIDWRMAATSIHNLVRGLSRPYVGAHFVYGNQIVKVWRTEVVHNDSLNLEPGKVLLTDDSGILVKAGTDAIRLCEIDPSIYVNVGDYL